MRSRDMRPPSHRPWVSARRRPSRRGTLATLALFLCASGVMKIGSGLDAAFASTGDAPAEAAAPPKSCNSADTPKALLDALSEREKRVRDEEIRAAEREQSLALARRQIDDRMAELQATEQKLAATIAQADQAADKDVAQLVAMYESMKPKDAARLFAEMDPEFAAGFLARMQPAAAAAVLSGLDPAKAYSFSVVLAGRNALAPKS